MQFISITCIHTKCEFDISNTIRVMLWTKSKYLKMRQVNNLKSRAACYRQATQKSSFLSLGLYYFLTVFSYKVAWYYLSFMQNNKMSKHYFFLFVRTLHFHITVYFLPFLFLFLTNSSSEDSFPVIINVLLGKICKSCKRIYFEELKNKYEMNIQV